ncbi:hypothetical protein [Vibrio tarriae]|uniref:hypothetical protein n=1 Tax=Vibrio tarriae TaxID=2014742 RepID=UPI001E63465B|nr:hypothetical protein [Vibrio tarriae]
MKGDESQYELCYSNGFKSVLGVTNEHLEACMDQYGDDEEDQYYALQEKEEKLRVELDELQSRNDHSGAHWSKIESLEQQELRKHYHAPSGTFLDKIDENYPKCHLMVPATNSLLSSRHGWF